MRRREPLLVAVLVGAYVAAFHRFGLFDFADEGLQLAQAWRVAHGQRPYLDFHTGYGPLYFAWQGALMRWGGLGAVRAALVAGVGSAAGRRRISRMPGTVIFWPHEHMTSWPAWPI